MRTLYIVGAGSSRNYTQATHSIPGLQSPLNRDFFKMARLVLLKDELSKLRTVRSTLKVVASMYGLDYDSELEFLENDALGDLEGVMTALNLRRQLFESRVQIGMTAEEILKEMIARVILRALEGPECDLHRRLARKIDTDDVVLSFNYDTLLDAALRKEKKLDDGSYCVPFYGTMHDDNSARIENLAGNIDLIKLHGSLNWARCVECSSFNLAENPVSLSHLGDRGIDLKCPRCGSGKSSQILLIIPPIQTKEYSEDPFRFLWMHAVKRMQGIKKIVAIGYRFSENDRATEVLLRHGVGTNTEVDIDLVNKLTTEPGSDLERRVYRIFPHAKKPDWSFSLSEFLGS